MTGKGLIGIDLFQTADHPFAHGVKLRTVGLAQGGAVGVAIRRAGLDRHIHPAGLLRVERVTENQAISRPQCLFARTGIAGRIAPHLQQVGDSILVTRTRRRIFDLIEQGDEFGAERGGFPQVTHPATPHEARQHVGGIADRDGGELAEEVVLGQDEAACLPGTAVRTCERTALGKNGIAIVGVGPVACQLDAGHARFGERLKFFCLADAVLVQIAPDAQGGVLGVVGVEDPVARSYGNAVHHAAGVQFGECGKAIGGFLAVGQHGFIAEQFLA